MRFDRDLDYSIYFRFLQPGPGRTLVETSSSEGCWLHIALLRAVLLEQSSIPQKDRSKLLLKKGDELLFYLFVACYMICPYLSISMLLHMLRIQTPILPLKLLFFRKSNQILVGTQTYYIISQMLHGAGI
jgi:hypothetical protein